MAIMTHAKFHFNWLMLTSISGIWASERGGARAWRTTEKAGPDRVKCEQNVLLRYTLIKNMIKTSVRILNSVVAISNNFSDF